MNKLQELKNIRDHLNILFDAHDNMNEEEFKKYYTVSKEESINNNIKNLREILFELQ